MFNLRIIQAEFGDCLILEYGTEAAPLYTLIDGGPGHIFEQHLSSELTSVTNNGGRLDLIVLSHVDQDHIVGLLDLFSKISEQRANGVVEIVAVDQVWFNQFSQTVDPNGSIGPRFQSLVAGVQGRGLTMNHAGMSLNSIGQGHQLHLKSKLLGMSVNHQFDENMVKVGNVPGPIQFGNLSLTIVGPTPANLEKLSDEWNDWLDEHDDEANTDDPFVAANIDRSVPNLSSIMLLAEADGKTMLLTGDGRSDHLISGLDDLGLLDATGSIHVNLLKLPHHGSDRNVTKDFFSKITADIYVVSANGKHGNPDLSTLIWIVETAKEQNRQIEIVATNRTDSTDGLLVNNPPADFGYTLTIMANNQDAFVVDLTA
jgi:hypothetical protein